MIPRNVVRNSSNLITQPRPNQEQWGVLFLKILSVKGNVNILSLQCAAKACNTVSAAISVVVSEINPRSRRCSS